MFYDIEQFWSNCITVAIEPGALSASQRKTPFSSYNLVLQFNFFYIPSILTVIRQSIWLSNQDLLIKKNQQKKY